MAASSCRIDVQKAIAKYGAAAHLAILAVAPLFLFPFFGGETISVVLLWLSGVAAIWILMEPSLHYGESPRLARRRVLKAIVRDPLFWALLAVVCLTGLRALNTGIRMAYDAENASWRLTDADFPLLPGCVGSAGVLPFAVSVASLVLLQGCRNSLGKSARMAFLLTASIFAGLAASVAVGLVGFGHEALILQTKCSAFDPSYVGTAFAVYLLGGTVALFAAFERKWRMVMPFFAFAIGGTAAGLFAFAPSFVVAVFLVAESVLLIYVFVVSIRSLPASGEFKLLVVTGISLTLGGLLVMATLPKDVFDVRIAELTSLSFFSEDFYGQRAFLSDVALKSWLSRLWIGTGLGSFPFDFRFAATAENWQLFRGQVVGLPNGWWFLLAERGIVGALTLALTGGILLFSYVRRVVGWASAPAYLHPACLLAPVVLAYLGVTGTFDCSFLRADVLMATGAYLAISANSFTRMKD